MSRSPAALPGSSGNDAFLPLVESRFAVAAIKRLKQPNRRTPPPLVFVYGPSGCGKSHLLRTLVRDERRRDASQRIAHVTAAEFAAELAESSANKTIDDFQRRYRSIDLFVCEDVQSLQGRAESQQQLLATIDELLANGKRVAVTSSSAPGQLSSLPLRLINRFQGGVCAGISQPGEASRARLIEHFASLRQLPITEEAVERLAANIPVSPRELQAAILQLEMAARQQQRSIDREFVEQYLKTDVQPGRFTVATIAKSVARHFGLKLADLKSTKRSQGVLLPRQIAMYLAHERSGASLRKIAAYFARENHSCVAHACARLEKLLKSEAAIRHHVHQIEQSLTAHQGPAHR